MSKPDPQGTAIECADCHGHGLVNSHGEPDECSTCGGSGKNWLYPRGAVAKHYAGPLIGKIIAREAKP